jgi:hypothetical protein
LAQTGMGLVVVRAIRIKCILLHAIRAAYRRHRRLVAALISGRWQILAKLEWIASIGLDPSLFGTHSPRRTKATLIYRRTVNLRAVRLLLGHTKVESTVRYLGIEVDDALAIAGKRCAAPTCPRAA